MNLPNILSLSRIALIPFLIGAYYLPFYWGHSLAALIFVVAAITDYFDGFLARKLSLSTPFGAFIDPVADKLIVAAAIVIIIGKGHLPYLTIAGVIIIGREIAVSALREWMAEIGERANVAVSYMGKIKTTLQIISLIVLLYCHTDTQWWIKSAGYIMFYIAAGLTMWSMVIYFKAAWPMLSQKK